MMNTHSPPNAWQDSHASTLHTVKELSVAHQTLFTKLTPTIPDTSNQESSIYDTLITYSLSPTLLKLLAQAPSIVTLLSDLTQEYTLFLPHEGALQDFLKLYYKGKVPPEEAITALFEAHISKHYVPTKQFEYVPNIPMLLDVPKLAGPTTMRTRPMADGETFRLNVTGKLVTGDVLCKNGVLHIIDTVFPLPGGLLDTLEKLPTDELSLFNKAMATTGLARDLQSGDYAGSVIFAPNNAAWQEFEFSVLEFLFNTEPGSLYLKTILKHSMSQHGTTLFSSLEYPKNVLGDHRLTRSDGEPKLLQGTRGFGLESGLEGEMLWVTVRRYAGTVSMRVNGADVVVQDLVTGDGAVHIVEKVLLPGGAKEIDTIEGLKGILDRFL